MQPEIIVGVLSLCGTLIGTVGGHEMNLIKALIGGIVWIVACYFLIKFVGLNGGDDE